MEAPFLLLQSDCKLYSSFPFFCRGMNSQIIALIEIGGSHDECLLTQMHAIRNRGHQVLLMTSQEVMDRNPEFESHINQSIVFNLSQYSGNALSGAVWKALKANKVDIAVINTAQGKLIRSLCMKALFSKMEFVGIIHTTRMFTESFTQKIIHRKIKKYLLLSEFLKEKVAPQKGLELDYFYPLRFPVSTKNVERNSKQIAIIGGVEERRKDLTGFLQMIHSIQDPSLRFVFLGKSDPKNPEVVSFLKAIEQAGLEDRITTFDHFVSQEVFDEVVRSSALVLPLVHPNTPSADQYFKNQISGAMTVSFGYKIPMLIHQEYQHIREMQHAAFYYTIENFELALEEALANAEKKSVDMRNVPAYSVEVQEKRYADFLRL